LGPKHDVFGFSWRADLRQIWDHLGQKEGAFEVFSP